MSATKKNKDRKGKQEEFKKQAAQKNEQAAGKVERTHILANPSWQSNDDLIIRGDLMQALNDINTEIVSHVRVVNELYSQLGKLFQMIYNQNIKAGKVKLIYTWNDGSEATEQEVKDFNDKMAKLKADYEKHLKDEETQQKVNQNALKTGLVGTNGEPIGTTQDLDEDPNPVKGEDLSNKELSEESDEEAVHNNDLEEE